MPQIAYIALGAILALLGGVITQIFQHYIQQKKEDKSLLFQVNLNLLKQSPLSKLKKDPLKSAIFREELNNICIRIQSKRYRSLTVRLTKYALDDIFQTEENLNSLTKEVHRAINKPLIERYEKEIKKLIESSREALKKRTR